MSTNNMGINKLVPGSEYNMDAAETSSGEVSRLYNGPPETTGGGSTFGCEMMP